MKEIFAISETLLKDGREAREKRIAEVLEMPGKRPATFASMARKLETVK
jgi:hypothetical protein